MVGTEDEENEESEGPADSDVAKRFLVANGFLGAVVEALGAEVAELRAAEATACGDLSQVSLGTLKK